MASIITNDSEFEVLDDDAAADYVCAVCLVVATNVQRTDCCQGYYCKQCIENLLNHNHFTCPKCRQDLRGKYSPDETAMAEINVLTVRCPNKGKQCSWEGELQHLEDHIQSQCPKQSLQCACGIKPIDRCNLNAHMQRDCVLRMVRCKYCKCLVQFKGFEDHVQIVCPNYHIGCSNADCKASIRRRNIVSHQRRCRYRPIDCPNNCGQILRSIEKKDHLENECPKRTLACIHCNLEGIASFINGIHVNKECQHVRVPCLNKDCEEGMKRGFKKDHLDICPKRLVKCKYVGICDHIMKKEEEDLHYQIKMDEHLRLLYLKLLRDHKDLPQHKKMQDDLRQAKNEYATNSKHLNNRIYALEVKLSRKKAEEENSRISAMIDKSLAKLHEKMQHELHQAKNEHTTNTAELMNRIDVLELKLTKAKKENSRISRKIDKYNETVMHLSHQLNDFKRDMLKIKIGDLGTQIDNGMFVRSYQVEFFQAHLDLILKHAFKKHFYEQLVAAVAAPAVFVIIILCVLVFIIKSQ